MVPTGLGRKGLKAGAGRVIFLWRVPLFIAVPEKDIPGDAEADEARKGDSKKNILIDVKQLHDVIRSSGIQV